MDSPLDPQWILNRLERGELILRLRIDKGMRFDCFPYHLAGYLMSYTGSGRETQAYGFIYFNIEQDRLQNFDVIAKTDKEEVEHEIEEIVRRWGGPWKKEVNHAVKIGQVHYHHPYDTVPLSNLLVIQHLTLLLGLFYKDTRSRRTKAEKALIRDISYKLNAVVAAANQGLYLGWF